MINDLPCDVTHLTICIQKVAELINICLVLWQRRLSQGGRVVARCVSMSTQLPQGRRDPPQGDFHGRPWESS